MSIVLQITLGAIAVIAIGSFLVWLLICKVFDKMVQVMDEDDKKGEELK